MKELTLERVKELVHYDPETGVFTNKITRSSRSVKGQVLGVPDEDGYLRTGIDGRTIKLHRLAWFYVKGKWPIDKIDHKNRVKSDNRFDNLRESTNGQNRANSVEEQRALPKGVYYAHGTSNRFQAMIGIKGKPKHIGMFSSPEEAHEAFKKKHVELHGEFSPYFKGKNETSNT